MQPIAEYAGDVIGTSPRYAYSLDMVDGIVETLEERVLIDQATGVIMTYEELAPEAALNRLRQLALESRQSMRMVAEWVLRERPTTPLPKELRALTSPDDQ